ncbi:hypothetical protein CCMA1212_004513 [Trichoderma ghanense]|uniref:Uncharacterized protein n=1 Tax=Trichoderma ghanense TaxID=65468 RepID=A0ABY2H6L7_9HYPO
MVPSNSAVQLTFDVDDDRWLVSLTEAQQGMRRNARPYTDSTMQPFIIFQLYPLVSENHD